MASVHRVAVHFAGPAKRKSRKGHYGAGLGRSVLFLLVVRTDNEEQMLTDRFGEDYRRYAAKTGRFIPRISS